jgi:hypothetical protein
MLRPHPYSIGTNGQFRWGSPTGTEIYPVFYIPGGDPIIMGSVDTITYSIHREKLQVRPCGRVSPGGVVRGKRTIAGSMIFKIFQGSEMRNMLPQSAIYRNKILADELPPFTIVITIPAVGEDGQVRGDASQAPPYIIAITGVEIVDQAFSLSIDDTIVEQSFSYIARDIIDIQDSSLALGGGTSAEENIEDLEPNGYESTGKG